MKKKELLDMIKRLGEEVSRLQEDLADVRRELSYLRSSQPISVPIPMVYPAPGIFDQCPAGGPHEYPFPWHGIIPPPCRKCGVQGHKMEITCSDSTTTATLSEEGNSTITYAKPPSTLTSQEIRIEENVKSNPDHDFTAVELRHPAIRRKSLSSKRRS